MSRKQTEPTVAGTGLTATSAALADLRVLLVDDLIDTVQSFAMLLELDGAKVATAGGARQALSLAAAQDFDLLLCDIGMPEMDGFELIATLRKSGRNACIPAIALTGYGRGSDAQRATTAGFDRHMGKPVRLEELTRVAGELLRSRER